MSDFDKEFINDLARKYANTCEFRSDHNHDWQSVSNGYVEGFETCIRLIESYNLANEGSKETEKALAINDVSLIDWGFIEWLDRGMWSNHEKGVDGTMRQELWYNTYRFSAMKEPLTKEQLYEKYKATLDER